MKFRRTPLVPLDVRFTCAMCGKQIFHQIRVGSHFFLGADDIPNGWSLETGEDFMKAYCPDHASNR